MANWIVAVRGSTVYTLVFAATLEDALTAGAKKLNVEAPLLECSRFSPEASKGGQVAP